MTTDRKRFTGPQRLLHWLMAICILSMLFIGVGMVSTITSKYLTLVQIHKPLGIAILLLAALVLSSCGNTIRGAIAKQEAAALEAAL